MMPSPTVFMVGALIVVLVPFLVHYYLVHRTDYTVLPSILLAGPSGSGKTRLMTLFERGGGSPGTNHVNIELPTTRTTVNEHSVELSFSNTRENTSHDDVNDELNLHHRDSTHTRFILHDTPGSEKRRFHAFNYIASSVGSRMTESSKLRGVVFVVDSAAMGDDTTGGDSTSRAAEYLHDVLVALQKRMTSKKSSQAPSAVSVLIAANKEDLFTSYPAHVVKSSLEKELTKIRAAKGKGMLESTVGEDYGIVPEDQDSWIGALGSEKFSFDQMREFDVEVEVISGSVTTNSCPGVVKWWEWIIDRARR